MNSSQKNKIVEEIEIAKLENLKIKNHLMLEKFSFDKEKFVQQQKNQDVRLSQAQERIKQSQERIEVAKKNSKTNFWKSILTTLATMVGGVVVIMISLVVLC